MNFHAASDGATTGFRILFFRVGRVWQFTGESDRWQAEFRPEGLSTDAWCWPTYTFHIPGEWASGPYIACFASENKDLRVQSIQHGAGDRNLALFVVKRPRWRSSASILYKIPIFTYCAYNAEGCGSLYTGPRSKVTLNRPGCGAGGDPCDRETVDFYDTSSPRQTFAHWDAPFVCWLESNGYNVDYCTDVDVHRNEDGFLGSHHLMVTVGHDEYWTQEMRTNVERFIASGGNLAFFSGNTCWWRVHLADGGTAITCDKRKAAEGSEAPDQWMGFDPETRMTGVSFRFGGGWWSGQREAVGYTVQNSRHWVYDGTGLKDGDVFGGGPEQALVGYECDGLPLCRVRDNHGYLVPDNSRGTPDTFQILGTAPLSSRWEYRETENATAVLGTYTRGGTVFSAATTDWARVLRDGDPVVDRITRNVLNRLSSTPG